MKKTITAAAFAGGLFVTAFASSAAQAQGMPDGSELRGAVIRVEFSDGIQNTVNFHPDGTATIQSQNGMQTVAGRWLVQGNQLCLEVAADRRECWNYTARFADGQQYVLTSSCGTSRWTALSTAAPPSSGQRGERG